MTLTPNPDPSSNEIMLIVQSSAHDLDFWLWDGETWSSLVVPVIDTNLNKNEPFVFLWNYY